MIYKSLFLFFLLSSIVFSGTIDPNVPDSKYVEYGKKFTSVVKVTTINIKKNRSGSGSGVVIKPKWVLTSAHIVSDSSEIVLVELDEKTMYVADKIIIHKDFDEKNTRADLALIKLNKSIELESYPELYSEQDEVGKECSMSGYGLTGTFETGVSIKDNKKRAGKSRISEVQNTDMLMAEIKNNRTGLDYAICSGDSGGGMFIQGKLAGINCCVQSRDGKPDSDYGDDIGFMRISTYRKWVLENIEE